MATGSDTAQWVAIATVGAAVVASYVQVQHLKLAQKGCRVRSRKCKPCRKGTRRR